ncbi:HS12A-like protein [Mya arenaria]|uniref:HS12A-like protein n=1 Tax=Mya arenaria TaxID=6604 RepID=A0ABY7G0H6_MYAAR|nr:HS12A-like protein [Mya arenaria]
MEYSFRCIDVGQTNRSPTLKVPLLVVGIDFGTTYSGWSYSFKHDFELNPIKVETMGWHGDQFVSSKAILSVSNSYTFDFKRDITRDMDIEDETGKKLNAKAGISSDTLMIALEPEAAAKYCRFLPAEKTEHEDSFCKFKTGSKVLSIDAEGGTVYISVQEVAENGSMKNIYKASGGDWGEAKVDEAYAIKAPLLVAGIDFGTTYSGWSYSFRHEFEHDPTKVATKSWYGDQLVSLKAPTCVLVEPDGETFSAFGYDAESKYTSLVEAEEHEKWYFFRRFKMKLHNKAGIPSYNLIIALEPEAAAVYCRFLQKKNEEDSSLSTFKTGSKVLVVDAGGGTVDIAVQEVAENGSMKNIYKASGGDWGGTKVDEAYVIFLQNMLGKDSIDAFKRCYMEDYIFMIRDFEMKKRGVDPLKSERPVIFRVSAMLPKLIKKTRGKKIHEAITDSPFDSTVSIQGDKLKVDMSVVATFFKTQIDAIVDEVSNIIEQSTIGDIDAIVLVGGFSNCSLLQQAIKSRFVNHTIIIPNDADLAVLKGAVIFGHKPELITQRVSKYTYGLRMKRPFVDKVHNEYYKVIREDGKVCCGNCFDIHITAGQCLFVGEAQVQKSYTPAKSTPTCVLIEPDGKTFSAFGFDAETKYTSLVKANEHDKWYYFKRFKMKLYNKLSSQKPQPFTVDIYPEKQGHNVILTHITGGTVDIAVQEVADNGSMKNIYKASGGDWGGTKVNEAYVKFLENMLGADSIEAFKQSNMEDYIYMIRDFEMKKRDLDPLKNDRPVVFRISAMLPKLVKKSRGKKIYDVIKDSPFESTVSIQGDKLKVDMSIVSNFFKTHVDAIVEHVSNLIDQSTIAGQYLIVGEAQVEKKYVASTSSQIHQYFYVYYTLDPDPMVVFSFLCFRKCYVSKHQPVGKRSLCKNIK